MYYDYKDFGRKLKRLGVDVSEKDFIYLNIWSIGCAPCISEIPLLEELTTKCEQNTTFVMISQHSDKAVDNFLNNRGIEISNLVLINEMDELISDIRKKINLPELVFPAHVILDKHGNVLAFLIGAFQDSDSLIPIVNFLSTRKLQPLK